MNSARRVVVLGILLLGGLGALGCAHYHQPPGVFQPPLAPEVRAQLGTVGVRWAGAAEPSFSYKQPVKSRWTGAGRGASAAMGGYFAILSGGRGDPLGTLGLLAIGVTAVPLVGASVGAIATPSAAVVEEAEAALMQAQADLWTAERLQGRVLEAAQTQTQYVFVGLSSPAPPTEAEPLPDSPARAVAADGVQTVLELSTARLQLTTEQRGTAINPDLQLLVSLECRLLRSADNEVLATFEVMSRSPEARTLLAWGANGAQAFRTATEAGTREVVAKILHQLFPEEGPTVQPGQEAPVGQGHGE
jgi:hypothetical protein